MAPTELPRRKIGTDYVSAIGMGCMSFSIPNSAGVPDETESLKVLTAAADLGINFWVTSDAYGPSHNESLIGRWFAETGRRDEIFLCTKTGVDRSNGQQAVSGKPDFIKEACQASLERLQTDRIDLFGIHRIDPNTPIEETIGALVELKQEGKIRYLGLSECSARTLVRANAVHPIAAVEMEYSLFALEIESEQTGFLKTARELGVTIVPYSPLGRGFLTGAIKSRDDFDPKDARLTMFPRFSEENFAGNLRLVEGVEILAKEKGCTPGQLALAWVLAQGEDFIPIPGTKHVRYLDQNAQAVQVEICKEDEKRVRDVIEQVGGIKGARYPLAHMPLLFGDSPELDGK